MVQNSVFRWLRSVMLLAALGIGWSAPATAEAPGRYALSDSAGLVQEVSVADNSLVIDGVRYRMAPDGKVEIRGSYGALSMLQAGMRVYFEFLRVSPQERRIVLLQELPDNVELEEV